MNISKNRGHKIMIVKVVLFQTIYLFQLNFQGNFRLRSDHLIAETFHPTVNLARFTRSAPRNYLSYHSKWPQHPPVCLRVF